MHPPTILRDPFQLSTMPCDALLPALQSEREREFDVISYHGEYPSYVSEDLSLEQHGSLMSDETLRSITFLLNWTPDIIWSGVKMAQAAFYCVVCTVRCVSCHRGLWLWNAKDNSMTVLFIQGLECGYKEYKNDLLLADELKNTTLLTMPAMYGIQPGRMDTADSGLPSASCKTCYKKTSQVVQATQIGLPCGHLIYCDKCNQVERNNGYKSRCPALCYDGIETTTRSVPDNLKWIFNPSLHGISSAVPSLPSYLTDALCYAGGVDYTDTHNPLSFARLQELNEMSPPDYVGTVRNELTSEQLTWLMSMLLSRIKTFLDNWPHAGSLSGEKMAEAGFYYSGGYDSVRCVFCGVVISQWEARDNPITEHIKKFSSCGFLQRLRSGMECATVQPTEDGTPEEETGN